MREDRFGSISDEDLLRRVKAAGGQRKFAAQEGLSDRWLRVLLSRRGIVMRRGRPKKVMTGRLERSYFGKFAKWWQKEGRYKTGMKSCRDYARASDINIYAIKAFFQRRREEFQEIIDTKTDLIRSGKVLRSTDGKTFPAAAIAKLTGRKLDPYAVVVVFNAVLRPDIPVKIRLDLREYLSWFGLEVPTLVNQVVKRIPRA